MLQAFFRHLFLLVASKGGDDLGSSVDGNALLMSDFNREWPD